MGIDAKGMQFLLAARRLGVSFERTTTIGRQRLYLTPSWLRNGLRVFGMELDPQAVTRLFEDSGGFAEPLLTLLGAKQVCSLDASAYEGASHVVDLNQPLPAELEGTCTAVVDAGSLEHVFDFPTAISNCMRMVALDGHLVVVTVANNMAGHGFYQFSPELFYRVLSEENGFRIERMLVTEFSSKRWYEVADPAAIRDRAQLRTFRPVYLCVAARRTAVRPVLATSPQQSDYVVKWTDKGMSTPQSRGTELHPIEQRLPLTLAMEMRSLYHLAQALVLPFDRRAFRRVDIADLRD